MIYDKMEYHRGHTLGKLPTNWKDLANFIAGKRSRFRLGHVKKANCISHYSLPDRMVGNIEI